MSDDGLAVTHHDGPAAHDDARPNRSQPVFYFDLASPEAYLAAERVMAQLPIVPEWVPVLAAGLPVGGATAPSDAAARRVAVERRAERQDVQPLRWPPGWYHQDSRLAMVGATYARQIGRAVAFSLAAFRQVFAGGRMLDEDTILIAAAACEMHPRAVLQALGRRSVAAALDDATATAAAAGVTQVPAIVVGDAVYEGEDAVEQAAAALAGRAESA